MGRKGEEARLRKAQNPTVKDQGKSKDQNSMIKGKYSVEFRLRMSAPWSLRFPWNLSVGAWIFPGMAV
jgi:hypothetical protein